MWWIFFFFVPDRVNWSTARVWALYAFVVRTCLKGERVGEKTRLFDDVCSTGKSMIMYTKRRDCCSPPVYNAIGVCSAAHRSRRDPWNWSRPGGAEEGISVIFLSHFQAYALPLKYQTRINGKFQEFEHF